MPLNPKRTFKTVIEGDLGLNEDGMWALYDDGEELIYWDEGIQMEALIDGEWQQGVVAWEDEQYVLQLPTGETRRLTEGGRVRRRVGGSV